MEIDRLQEETRLGYVRTEIAEQKQNKANFIDELESTILRKQANLKEGRSQMKMDEIPQKVNEINLLIENYEQEKRALQILISALSNPYFGKITFEDEGFYVGKFGVQSIDGKDVIVNDWRAPVSSLFYDYELGHAKYVSPDGVVEGELSEKLQFKISNGILDYVIDTSLTINDNILQKTLAENTTNSLKTIVATIQKKQNEVIRQALNKTTVVQGVAGSGKTSIALHRIAFLLYNNRKNLSSSNILIFSPSKVFSSYISSILPELGEQNVKEVCFDDVFKAEFAEICNFETRTEQIERLLTPGIQLKSNEFKNSLEFTQKLTEYLDEFFVSNFKTRDVKVGSRDFSKEQLQSYIEHRNKGSINDKIKFLANAIVSLVTVAKKLTNTGEEILERSAYATVLKMLKQKNIFKIYASFLLKNKLAPFNQTYLAAEDTYALLYIKNYIFGANADESIKHVVIDEMQDYNATALSIISQMYSCPKTILGDFHQMVDGAFDENKLKVVEKLFCENGEILRLNRNYRSTIENNSLANKILEISSIEEPIRHGEKPTFIEIEQSKLANETSRLLDECEKKHFEHVAIITKTTPQAVELYAQIKLKGRTINLVTPKTEQFVGGICVGAAHLVKGLEFDAVIMVDASKTNYNTPIDKQSLYISATRALHKIYVLTIGELTKFLK